MYLRHSTKTKGGKTHTYWRLVRSVRRNGKVVQETVAQLGELDAEGRAQAAALARQITGVRSNGSCSKSSRPGRTGNYGFIPVDATTQFVVGAYAGSDSDGTQAKPWKRIQDGIDHADSEAIVAVAAGSYVEDPSIQARPVQLWGRCPALVQVVGTGGGAALTTTGEGADVTIEATVVRANQLYSHATSGWGIGVEADPATQKRATLTLRSSLLEQNQGGGVLVEGSDATIEATVVRARFQPSALRPELCAHPPPSAQRARLRREARPGMAGAAARNGRLGTRFHPVGFLRTAA